MIPLSPGCFTRAQMLRHGLKMTFRASCIGNPGLLCFFEDGFTLTTGGGNGGGAGTTTIRCGIFKVLLFYTEQHGRSIYAERPFRSQFSS
jgi:hypothetical protein